MCILFIYTNPVIKPGCYRLILVSNRDEYYIRPAQNVAHMKEDEIIAGLDMEPGREGGMWLGLSTKTTQSKKIRIGALLNISGAAREVNSKDRGSIVSNYLKSSTSAEEYVNLLKNNAPYKPHHFVAVELSDDDSTIHHTSNVPTVVLHKFSGSQLLGFGNTSINSPFEKVKAGCKRFKEIIENFNDVQKKEDLIKNLIEFLKWEKRHLPDEELEKRDEIVREFLSSIFVKIVEGGYGTRAHSVILVDYDWNVEYMEIAMEQPIDPRNPTWIANNITVSV